MNKTNPIGVRFNAELLDYMESDHIPSWVTPTTIKLWLGKEDEVKPPKKRWWKFWKRKATTLR